MDKIRGLVERVTFYNEDNGYGVIKLRLDYKDEIVKKYIDTFFSNVVSVVAFFDRKPLEDEEYIFSGDIVTDPKWGLQFRATTFERCNDTLESVVAYLSSDMFPGVGEKIAKKIYKELGPNCIDEITSDKKVLDKIKINEGLKNTIYNTISENKEKETDILGLLSLGLTMKMAIRISSVLTKDAFNTVKKNPYLLIDLVDGIGFIRADAIALNNGIKPNSQIRIKAYINYYLNELINRTGDTYIEEDLLKDKLFEALNKKEDLITLESFNRGIKGLIRNKKIFVDEDRNVYNYRIYNSENEIANFVSSVLKSESSKEFNKKNIDIAIERIKQGFNIEYNEKQEAAIRNALKENISIVTGGPGTGKTTIIKGIIEAYVLIKKKEVIRDKISLLAPTGRAAKRLSEVTLHKAQTIHKFLGYNSDGFKYGNDEKIDTELVIIDEFSMVDTLLCAHLFSALNESTKIVIVGDVNQLPSIGAGEVLANLIESKEVTTTTLNKIHRQAQDSSIISLAHSINNGLIPDDILEKKKDRSFSIVYNEYIASSTITIIKKALEKGLDIIRDIQVLVPLYKGKNGIDALNKLIQATVNPLDGVEINRKEYSFREKDKVIQLVNRADKGVMNGDIGYIKRIEKIDNLYNVTVSFDNGEVEYDYDELSDLRLAYAISIHKAQGSEFSCVIVPFSMEYRFMLRRKLIYTALTRAKDYLIMLGSIEALSLGVEGIEARRKTKLLEKIKKVVNSNLLEVDIDDSDLSPFDFME